MSDYFNNEENDFDVNPLSEEDNITTDNEDEVIEEPDENVTEEDTTCDITSEMENDSYKNILGKIADAVWNKYGGKTDYVNKATNRFESLVEIANGIRGEEPNYEDEEVVKKQPKNISQALISILNALNDVEDDFSKENEEYYKEIFNKPKESIKLIECIDSVIDTDEALGKTVKDFGIATIYEDGNIIGTLNYINKEEAPEVNEGEEIPSYVDKPGYYLVVKFKVTENITKLFVVANDTTSQIETSFAIYLGIDKHKAKRQRILLVGKNDNNEEVASLVIKPYNVTFLPFTNTVERN